MTSTHHHVDTSSSRNAITSTLAQHIFLVLTATLELKCVECKIGQEPPTPRSSLLMCLLHQVSPEMCAALKTPFLSILKSHRIFLMQILNFHSGVDSIPVYWRCKLERVILSQVRSNWKSGRTFAKKGLTDRSSWHALKLTRSAVSGPQGRYIYS